MNQTALTDFITNTLQNKWIELLTLVLWGVYVWFTIKTFNQIQKQTELQSRAFLVVAFSEIAIPDTHTFSPVTYQMHQKWRQILSAHLPSINSTPQALNLRFTNRGKSDIVDWEINVSLKIEPGDHLRNQRNTDGDVLTFTLKSQSSDIIAPGESKDVILMPYGYYPSVIVKWNIKYTDIMDGTYTVSNEKSPVQLYNFLVYKYLDTPRS